MNQIIAQALETPGWRSVEALLELASISGAITGPSPVIVEVGAFLGRSTLVLAGARQLCGAGRVHVVDPFNGDGDPFCKPLYAAMIAEAGGSLRDAFEAGLRRAGVADWVEQHVGYALERAQTWTQPIDLLVLDADDTVEAAFATYKAWIRHLKPGGRLVLSHATGAGGNALLAHWLPRSGLFMNIRGTEQTVATYRGAHPIQIHLYAQLTAKGESQESALDRFFDHYDPVVARYVIYDNGSDAALSERLRQHPMVERRGFERAAAAVPSSAAQDFPNACWKESRGAADWVILVDLDELLWRPDLLSYLLECYQDGVTVIPALGRRMKWGREIAEGSPSRKLNKVCVFRPETMIETNFSAGRGLANLYGHVALPDRDELLLLKYDRADGAAPDAQALPHLPWWRRRSLAACFSAGAWDGVSDYLTLDAPDADLLKPLDIWLLIALAEGTPPDPGLALYPISAYCGELLRLGPVGAAERAVALAQAMIATDRLDDAISLFEALAPLLDRATLVVIATGWTAYCLARAYQRAWRLESARALLFKELTRGELDGDLAAALAWLALELDRPLWAETRLASLQAADRMTASAWTLTARLRLSQNFLDEAEEALRALDDANLSSAEAEGRRSLWVELLWSLDKAGEGPKARSILKGLDLPDAEATLELICWLEAGHGDPAVADALTRAARQRFPRNRHFDAAMTLLQNRLPRTVSEP